MLQLSSLWFSSICLRLISVSIRKKCSIRWLLFLRPKRLAASESRCSSQLMKLFKSFCCRSATTVTVRESLNSDLLPVLGGVMDSELYCNAEVSFCYGATKGMCKYTCLTHLCREKSESVFFLKDNVSVVPLGWDQGRLMDWRLRLMSL